MIETDTASRRRCNATTNDQVACEAHTMIEETTRTTPPNLAQPDKAKQHRCIRLGRRRKGKTELRAITADVQRALAAA